MSKTIKRILMCGAIIAVVGVVFYVIAIVTLFSSWDCTIKEYNDTYKTSYGDVLTVKYSEFNFPDSCSSTVLVNEKTSQTIGFIDDPAVESTYLEECYNDENYNVYYFHKAFVFINKQEMFYVPQKDLYEQCSLNYKKYPKLIKTLILDGNRAITRLYTQFYLKGKGCGGAGENSDNC